MCATSSEPVPPRQPLRARGPGGFTLIELMAVMVMVGVLAVVALPRLQGATAFRDLAWRDQVVSALRHAQATAYSHRRLVCATLSGNTLSLHIASAHPATTCTTPLPGPDGTAIAASADAGAAPAVLSPSGVLYFQPSGRVTSDGAGNTASSRTVTISDLDPVVIVGETGHVR